MLHSRAMSPSPSPLLSPGEARAGTPRTPFESGGVAVRPGLIMRYYFPNRISRRCRRFPAYELAYEIHQRQINLSNVATTCRIGRARLAGY